jgi:hypothetical protein
MGLGELLSYYVWSFPAFLVAVLVFQDCAGRVRTARRLRDHGLVAEANVLHAEVMDLNVQTPATYDAAVAFCTDTGREISTRIKFQVRWRPTDRGDVIPVRFDPLDPTVAMLDRGAHHGRHELRWCVPALVVAALLAGFIVAVLLTATAEYLYSMWR